MTLASADGKELSERGGHDLLDGPTRVERVERALEDELQSLTDVSAAPAGGPRERLPQKQNLTVPVRV
jgi:hypothetical protein